jgi:hypothetical protein
VLVGVLSHHETALCNLAEIVFVDIKKIFEYPWTVYVRL